LLTKSQNKKKLVIGSHEHCLVDRDNAGHALCKYFKALGT